MISIALENYCFAVSQRRALDKHGVCNHAILRQVEDEDIPLLLEIIRVQAFTMEKAFEAGDDEEDSFAILQRGLFKIEQLAQSGNCKKWGEADSKAN